MAASLRGVEMVGKPKHDIAAKAVRVTFRGIPESIQQVCVHISRY
jgi:hypothetical protein